LTGKHHYIHQRFGKDYSNFIIKDFDDLESPYRDLIDRNVMHRMPWHDISACMYGDAARDAARHFIQRWNYSKMKKARNNTRFPLLLPKAYDLNIEHTQLSKLITHANGFSNCRVQCLRSVCNWSAGLSATECSIHNAIKNLIRKAKHYIYIENQFFISLVNSNADSAASTSGIKNEIAQCLYERIFEAHSKKEKFKVG
jgi:phospholipase D1/2